MKKVTVMLMLLSLLLCGCGRHKADTEDTVTFYYPRRDILYGSADGVITPEEREASISGDTLEERLRIYLSGPKTEGLVSPFPEGTTLIDLRQEYGILTLVLGSPFFEMDGLELTAACASLSRTCFALTDAAELVICSEDNEHRIELPRDSFLFFDESDAIEMTIGTEPLE